MKKILLLLILVGIAGAAVRPVTYYGPRKAGMGGAGVAMIDKRESLYYNPASVVDIDSVVVIPLIQGTILMGPSTMSSLKKLSLVGDDNDQIVENFRSLIPTKIGMGYNTSGHWVTPTGIGYVGIGMYSSNTFGAKIVNPISPRLDIVGSSDLIFPSLTYGTQVDTEEGFLLKNVRVGATVKRITRTTLYDPDTGKDRLSLEVLNLIDPDNPAGLNYRTGTGYGLDLGVIGDTETFLGPTKVGIAITNISTRLEGMQYQNANSSSMNAKSKYTQDIPVLGTIGLSTKASYFAGVPVLDSLLGDTTYAADFEVIAPYNSFFKRLHLGLEQKYFSDFFALRMGLNQGYGTMGGDFNFGNVYHLGLSYYTEEFGDEIGQNPQSFYVLDGGFYW